MKEVSFMKKVISLVILIACLFLIYQTGVTFLKRGHEVEYSIKSENHTFLIQEQLKNQKYYFQISVGSREFYLEENNQLNKMKQVIEDIYVVEEDGMMCIYPILKKGNFQSMMCHDGARMYAFESSKHTSSAIKLIQKIQSNHIVVPFLENVEETEQKNGQVTYFTSAMDPNEEITLWFYQGFSVFNRERSFYEDTISFDRYENTHSELVGKFYVTPKYIDNRLYEFSSVLVFDVTNHVKFELDLGTTLSNYTYINGIVDSKLYLFDKNTMQQIEINPASKKARIIASGSGDAMYYNGKWENRNIYDFVNEKITFMYFDDTELRARYVYNSSYMSGDSYYFYDGFSFYQVYKDSLNTPILLFSQEGIKDIRVVDGHIYYIYEDTLYKYSPTLGRKRIMKYNEFSYNSSSLYDIYRK